MFEQLTQWVSLIPLFVIIWRVERRFNNLENKLGLCPHIDHNNGPRQTVNEKTAIHSHAINN